MIARQDISSGVALSEVAAILATGYERLIAQTGAEAKNDDHSPYHSELDRLNRLDVPGHQRDVSDSPERLTEKQKAS